MAEKDAAAAALEARVAQLEAATETAEMEQERSAATAVAARGAAERAASELAKARAVEARVQALPFSEVVVAASELLSWPLLHVLPFL